MLLIYTQILKDSYKEVPQTPLVPDGVVCSARLSEKTVLSLTDPVHTVRVLESDGPSFSCAVASVSSRPEAETEDGAEGDDVVGSKVKDEVVDLSGLLA